jgi:fumarate reductase flavoprotein subunit
VIGQDLKPIEGFYAAGTDARSIYGDIYHFIFPVTSRDFVLNTGRIAAESIANKYKTS